MTEVLTFETAVLIAAGAAAVLLGFAVLRGPRQGAAPREAPPDPAGPVLLFEGAHLADCSAAVEAVFDRAEAGFLWSHLRQALEGCYPGLPPSPEVLPDRGRLTLSARGGLDAGDILIERMDDVTRVQLAPDSLSPATRERPVPAELGELRQAMDAAPYPIWRLDGDGFVCWYNAAYADILRKLRGRDADLSRPLLPPERKALEPGRRTRVPVEVEAGKGDRDRKAWFDVTMIRQEAGELFFANDINAVVDAEIAQRNFVQTLAKTFAQLSIGLAIFDRNRQLALFNPALVDLTSLPVDFLSARPTLFSFFDRLRDRKMLPEPRDFRCWRQQMAELDAAAADGHYQETWSLPSGSVYSVSGRPHPDGAMAFLIEDITAEVTLTRRFRSDLELGQAIVDQIEDAIAVFAPDGSLTYSNRAYRSLWGVDPDRSFAQVTIVDATRAWQDKCAPTPVWGEIRDFVAQREKRVDWWAEVRLRGGGALTCAVSPIVSGATMVRFRQSGRAVSPSERDAVPASA